MTIESQLRELKTRSEAVAATRTRAQIELDNAKAKLLDAKRVLKEEHGLNTGAEIDARVAELKAELETTISEIEDELKAAGA